MSRLYDHDNYPVDFCINCFPVEGQADIDFQNHKGYDKKHPPYSETDFHCHECGISLTDEDNREGTMSRDEGEVLHAEIVVKFRMSNVCWATDLEGLTFEAMVGSIILSEGLFGIVDDGYEIVSIKQVADEDGGL